MKQKKQIILNLSKGEYIIAGSNPKKWNDNMEIFNNFKELCVILPLVPYSQQRRTINIINVLKKTSYSGKIFLFNPLDYLSSYRKFLYLQDKHCFHNFNGEIIKEPLKNVSLPSMFYSNYKGYGTYIDCSPEVLIKNTKPQKIEQKYYDIFQKPPVKHY